MKRALALLLWITLSTTLFALPLTPASNGSTNCYSDSELEAFEAAMQEEVQRAVKESVEAAIAPYKAQAARQESTILWLKVGIGVSLGFAVGASVWALLK